VSTEVAAHSGGRDRGRRWRVHSDAGAWVNNGDCVTDPGCSRLMQLEGCWLALVRWNVWVRVGVESEAGIGRDLVRLWAGFR
jgi:hypothetical protein